MQVQVNLSNFVQCREKGNLNIKMENNEKITESELFCALFPQGTRKPDIDQTAAIIKTDNAVVSAGAGSGKTEVLATRYAYLLMTNPSLRVKNILALTFTKKAAAEIYARVFKKLNEFYSRLSDEKYGDRFLGEGKPATLLKRAINELSEAKIQTLDSYSGDIVRLAASQYGIRPDFKIGSGTNGKDALEFVLRYKDHPEFSTAYKTFCKVGKIEDFAKTYFSAPIENYTSIATERHFFSGHLKFQAEEIVEAWNGAIFGKDDDDNNSAKKQWDILKASFFTWQSELENEKKAKIPLFFENLKILFKNFTENPPFTKIDDASILFDKNARANTVQKLKEVMDFLDRFSKAGRLPGKTTSYAVQTVKECISFFRPPKTNQFCLVPILHSCVDFIEHFEAISEMYELMDLYTDEVNISKRISGVLSFKDVSDLALKILLEDRAVRNQQKRQIKKIMIDEFQDNNSKNRDMLYLIAENDEVFTEFKTRDESSEEFDDARYVKTECNSATYNTFIAKLKKNLSPEKLFFVGDEKQSIYKFRGADVSVFNGLKTTLTGLSGNSEDAQLTMTNNYRSTVALLKSFNVLFGDDKKKIPNETEKTLPSLFYCNSYLKVPEYEATYLFNGDKRKSSYATKPDSNGNDAVSTFSLDEKSVRLHACILNSGENFDEKKFSDYRKKNICLSTDETAGYFIAKTISDMHKQGKRFSEFAILDSSRTHRKDIQKFLSVFKIPYTIDVQKNIFSEGIANDLYNFLRICVYPNDSNAFASFLTSPFVGMSETGAMSVMSTMHGKNPVEKSDNDKSYKNTSFSAFSAFSKKCEVSSLALSEDDEKKYRKGADLYFEEQKSILSSSITKTIENLWYTLGYFFETERDENVKMYAEQFDLLYQIALNAETADKDIAWFVDQLALTKQMESSFSETEEAELDTEDVHYPLERRDAVTIMTIHQSKGLEFGTVFITGIFSNPRGEKQGDVFFDEDSGLSIRANDGGQNYFYLRQMEESKKKEAAEQKRKIYVAITRARNEAFLVGTVSLPKNLLSSNPSIMHKIVRYYYNSDNGLYQDNDYEFKSGISAAPYYNKTENAPFDFIKINPIPTSLFSAKTDLKADAENTLASHQTFLEKEEAHFTGSAIEDSENPTVQQEQSLSPSRMEKLFHSAAASDAFSKNAISSEKETLLQNPIFNDLDGLLAHFSSDDEEKETEESAFSLPFTKAHFGTMAHSYLEQWVKSGNIESVETSEDFDEKLRHILNDNFGFGDKRKCLSEICRQMVRNFSSSKLGKSILEAKRENRLVKTEYAFKMTLGTYFVSGSIDVFFENKDGTFTIIDYKTDNTEKDGKLHPEIYIEQQACYRFALSKIYGIDIAKIKTVLYFLRFDTCIDITAFSNLSETTFEEKITDALKMPLTAQ